MGLREMQEIANGTRDVKEISNWACHNPHIVYGGFYSETSPLTGERIKMTSVMGEAAINDRLYVIQSLVAYMFGNEIRSDYLVEKEYLITKTCIAAMHWRAFRCWAYLRKLGGEPLPSPLFDAIMTLDVGAFDALIKDGFCDLEEEHDQEKLTPLGYAVAHKRWAHAKFLLNAGANVDALPEDARATTLLMGMSAVAVSSTMETETAGSGRGMSGK